MNCRDYARDGHMWNRNGYDSVKKKKYRNFHGDSNYNPLHDYNVECYKCNNFCHKSHDCRSFVKSRLKENVVVIHEEKPIKGWKREQEEKKKEECNLVLYVETKKSNVYWHWVFKAYD